MKEYPGSMIALDEDAVVRLMSVLPTGKTHAVTMAQLQRRMGLRPQRTAETARAIVKYAIERHHQLICTGARGVWAPTSVDEVHAYIDSLQSRMAGIQRRRDALTEALTIRAGVLADRANGGA